MQKFLTALRWLLAISLGFFGAQFLLANRSILEAWPWLAQLRGLQHIFTVALISILFGFCIFYFLGLLWKYGYVLVKTLAEGINSRPPVQVLGGTVGFLLSLILALFISNLFRLIGNRFVAVALAVPTYVILGYLGIYIGGRMGGEIPYLPDVMNRFPAPGLKSRSGVPKILDTSAIIDGRVVDIAATGFLEGDLVIPEFVLKELRHIADSSVDLTRAKGRRGLDYIQTLQELPSIHVVITGKDYKDIDEVDLKLLRLAQDMKGAVITSDYNLNKVAILQKIPVLNVNDLSNAVKPNAIPGEVFEVEILRKGKEADQGVGFLDDGTMIVVDKAKGRIGENLGVEVTSVLQTPAGRMIFAKIKE